MIDGPSTTPDFLGDAKLVPPPVTRVTFGGVLGAAIEALEELLERADEEERERLERALAELRR